MSNSRRLRCLFRVRKAQSGERIRNLRSGIVPTPREGKWQTSAAQTPASTRHSRKFFGCPPLLSSAAPRSPNTPHPRRKRCRPLMVSMAYPSPDEPVKAGAHEGGDGEPDPKRPRSAADETGATDDKANGVKSEGPTNAQRLYSCGKCSKSYARLDHLSRHVRMVCIRRHKPS